MNPLRPAILMILVLMAVWPTAARAQQDDDWAGTEARLRTLETQIEADEVRVRKARTEESASADRIKHLSREIRLREELVVAYERRRIELVAERDSLIALVGRLEADLEAIRTEYRFRVTTAYKHGRLYDLALILSASSINQMLVRVNYLRRFSEQRSRRLAEIQAATIHLNERRTELMSMVQQSERLIEAAVTENERLDAARRDGQRLVAELRSRRTGLEKELDSKREAARELQERIREMIRLAAARRSAAGSPIDAAAFTALSGSFRDNRGKLPWPVQGTVLEPYGLVIDPVYKTKTPNPGILIATQPAADVFSVFDGVVSSVEFIPDMGQVLLIQHGAYHSVYGNLSKAYVTAGQPIRAGMLIGRSGTDADPRGAGVFFAVFNDGSDVDPSGWLRRP